MGFINLSQNSGDNNSNNNQSPNPKSIPKVQSNGGGAPTGSEVVENQGPGFSSNQMGGRVDNNPLDGISNNGGLSNLGNDNATAPSPVVTSDDDRFSPQKNDVWYFLTLTEKREASDLHFTVDYPPMIRIDGSLQQVGQVALESGRVVDLFKPLMNQKQFDKLMENREIDFSVQNKTGARFRVNLYFERGNLAGAFRLIPHYIRTVEELGLPSILKSFTTFANGLILLTGPTGSGKSTTIASMINLINKTMPKHIITIEDPIEYLFGKGVALVDQREIEKDTHGFKNALKSALRQDPDVALVGEMRDHETIAATITLAETGHLVFATLHTNSAAQTVDRIIDVFPEHQQAQVRAQLATILQAIVAQRLVPLIGGGRKAVNEVLIGTSAVRNSIREGKTYQLDNLIQTSGDIGMFPLEKSLAELVRAGQITLDTALEYTTKPDFLKELVS